MGDGTPSPSRSTSDPFPANRLVHSGQPQGTERVARMLSRTVLYTHAHQAGEKLGHVTGRFPSALLCHNLEDLFGLLENDAVDHLVFDESITDQERKYVHGWARIFKPGVACELKTAFERRLSGSVA